MNRRPDGDQGLDRKGEEEAEIHDAACAAVPVVRPVTRRLSQVQDLPDMFPEPGARRVDPRCAESELVTAAYR
jgi:hypothetical protein